MSWPPGTIVECVDDTKPKFGCVVSGIPLKVGQRYTIRGRGTAQGLEVVTLAENVLQHPEFDREQPWDARRFRTPLPPERIQEIAEEFAEVYL